MAWTPSIPKRSGQSRHGKIQAFPPSAPDKAGMAASGFAAQIKKFRSRRAQKPSANQTPDTTQPADQRGAVVLPKYATALQCMDSRRQISMVWPPCNSGISGRSVSERSQLRSTSATTQDRTQHGSQKHLFDFDRDDRIREDAGGTTVNTCTSRRLRAENSLSVTLPRFIIASVPHGFQAKFPWPTQLLCGRKLTASVPRPRLRG